MSNLYRRNLPVPFFSQRENRYQWQRIAGDGGNDLSEATLTVSDISNGIEQRKYASNEPMGKPVSLAWMSCNMTSLCMILHYFGITTDTPDDMLRYFFDANDRRYRKQVYNSHLKDDPDHLGPNQIQVVDNLVNFIKTQYSTELNCVDIISTRADANPVVITLNTVKAAIANGYPVYFSFGVLSPYGPYGKNGHIGVIRGFTEHDDVIINDPYGDPSDHSGRLQQIAGNIPGLYNLPDSGLGTGDNIVILKDHFNRVIQEDGFNAIVIEYPRVWSFPFRDSAGNALRITDANDAEQIAEMRNMLDLSDGSFPIANLGAWKDGVDIKGQERQGVYAMGPGRLIAARIAQANEQDAPVFPNPYFTLVYHNLVQNGEPKHFFSYYYHLSPINVRQRIRERFNAVYEQEREKDWLDQLIDHIMPKKARLNVKAGDNLTGIVDDSMPKIYALNGTLMEDTKKQLGDRSHIYLCAQYDDLQKMLENIEPDENENSLLELYTNIDDNGKYKRTINGESYYGFYYHIPGNVSSVYYVEDNWRIQPQSVNLQEYAHYRSKIASLLKSEVVSFLGEDKTATNEAVKTQRKKTSRERFKETVDIVFAEDKFKDLRSAMSVGRSAEANIVKIKEVYLQMGLSGFNDLYNRFIELGRILMRYSIDEVSELYRFKENWRKEMVTALKEVFAFDFLSAIKNNTISSINIDAYEWGLENSEKQDGYKTVFCEILKLIFPTTLHENIIEANYRGNYSVIEAYYNEQITREINIENVKEEICLNFSILYHSLLNWNPANGNNKFAATDQWLLGNHGNNSGMSENGFNSTVKNIAGILCEMEYTDAFEIQLMHMQPINIDYHIEVNSNTKLGEVGQKSSGGQFLVHCSVFSHDRIITDTSEKFDNNHEYIEIRDTTRGPCYDCHEIVKILKEANVIDESVFKHLNANAITNDELALFYGTSLLPLSLVVNRPLVFGEVTSRTLSRIPGHSFGFFEHHENNIFNQSAHANYTWFTKENARELARSGIQLPYDKNCFYFDVIGFMRWLSK